MFAEFSPSRHFQDRKAARKRQRGSAYHDEHDTGRGATMIRILTVAAAAFLSVTLRAHAEAPLIIIDRWWGVDYAKQPCKTTAFKYAHPGMSEATCAQERTESYNRFELELKTQFAASPECAGIIVSSFGYPENPHKPPPDTSQPNWSLSLNYFGDNAAQLWQMLPPKGSDLPMMQATEPPSQIAKHVCTIIKGKGGAVTQ
jgi:hypothetical protein